MRKIWVLVVFCLVVIYACKHEIAVVNGTGQTGNGGGTGGGQTTQICFEADILPIFNTNCAKSGCHDVASHNQGYVFDSYANIVKKGIVAGFADKSDVYEKITETDPGKRMPQPPNPELTAAQKDLIKRWINEGAKNTTNCRVVCDSAKFSYLAVIRPVIDNNCVGCHNGPGAPRGLDYTNYNILKTVAANGRLMGAITHSPGYVAMPLGKPPLDICDIIKIRKWAAAGAPNN
jgi:hypothetical protein